MAGSEPIPFNRPSLRGNEFPYMARAVEQNHISGDGHYTKACHSFLEQLFGARKALLTTSCTHALEMTAILLDTQPGDEFIVPSFTFVSTANAFVLRGARPVFADVRADTLNLDESQVERLITPRTRAILPVHYAGVGCEMDALMAIAEKHNLALIEDNAHGLFGKYRGRPLGTFGAFSTLSFHETKNITCGEGGALIVNARDYAERAEIIREKGTNRSSFFRGQVDKYSWVDVGSSYLPSDLLAAFLLCQLEDSAQIQATRKRIWDFYYTNLSDWATKVGATLPFVPEYCEQAYHMFYLLMPSLESRQALIAHLKQRGVQSVFHYLPLHLSGMGLRFGGRIGDCPITESISDRLIRLPFFNSLQEDAQARVLEAVMQF